MDADEFKSRLILSRTWTVDHELDIEPNPATNFAGIKGKPLGASFTLRMPSDQDVQRAFIRHRGPDGELPDAEVPVVQYEIALMSLINWQGVHGHMIDPGGKFDGEVPFDKDFAAFLLESDTTITNALANHVFRRRNERQERRETDLKNSERASTTNET